MRFVGERVDNDIAYRHAESNETDQNNMTSWEYILTFSALLNRADDIRARENIDDRARTSCRSHKNISTLFSRRNILFETYIYLYTLP